MFKQSIIANELISYIVYLNSSVPTVVLANNGVKRKWLRGLITITSKRSLLMVFRTL